MWIVENNLNIHAYIVITNLEESQIFKDMREIIVKIQGMLW